MDKRRNTATHGNTRQHIITHCNTLQRTLQRTTTNCITYVNICRWIKHAILQRTATHCNALQRTAMHCNALQHTATHGNTRQHTAIHTLQRTATHCNTLQDTATHCNTLQHTATHCNTYRWLKDATLAAKYLGEERAKALVESKEDAIFVVSKFTDDPEVTHCNALR